MSLTATGVPHSLVLVQTNVSCICSNKSQTHTFVHTHSHTLSLPFSFSLPPSLSLSLSLFLSHSFSRYVLQVQTHLEGFTPANALDIVRGYDVVLDATDNPATRYLIRWVQDGPNPYTVTVWVRRVTWWIALPSRGIGAGGLQAICRSCSPVTYTYGWLQPFTVWCMYGTFGRAYGRIYAVYTYNSGLPYLYVSQKPQIRAARHQ